MKGDPRIAAQCPFCPHWCRPRPRLDDKGFVKVTTTIAVVKNSMRLHFTSAHPGLDQRRIVEELGRVERELKAMQTQLPTPAKLAPGRPSLRILVPCPVPDCETRMQTWVDAERDNFTAAARDRLRQHLARAHPELTLRAKMLWTGDVRYEVVTIIIDENGASPAVHPRGPGAGGPASLDPVAPSRPGDQAHASGKVDNPINVSPIKLGVRTSKSSKVAEVQVAGQP